jgi:hypothetical protein
MARNKVLQFEGDIRMWEIDPTTSARTPVVADAADIYGNIPIEASASVFGYEAGEQVNVLSKRRERYNQAIFSEQLPGQSNLSITLVAVPPAIVASVYYGAAADVSVTGSAVEDEVVTFTATELSQPLAHTYIAASPAPVVTGPGGTPTYVAGEDYVIDRRLGRIRRIADGDITATGSVEVSYTYTSFTLVRIRGCVQPQRNFYIEGDFKNRPDQSDMRLTVWNAALSTDGEVDLFSAEPITVTLAGPLITPESETEPYIVELINNEA